MVKEKKRETGPTLSTYNFHFSKEKKRQSGPAWNPSTSTLAFVDIS
jgi:hypothetical protein